MDDDDVSILEYSPGGSSTQLNEQNEALLSYLNSVPYICESSEEMQQKLEWIVGNLYISAKAKNFQSISSWDALLQCWLIMRYPMSKSTRAKLVTFYYELSVLPGIDMRNLRSWSEMIMRLGCNKPGLKRKLEPSDLELSWKPLWRALQKDLWKDSGKKLASQYLELASLCRIFFPADAIPEMLETFLPLLTFDTVLIISTVMTAFLPPANPDTYIPAIFKIWEAFNSANLDEQFIELAGELTQIHVSGPAGQYKDGAAQFKDIGIWTTRQWSILTSKGLNLMNIPVGNMKNSSQTASHADGSLEKPPSKSKGVNRIGNLAKIFVYSMSVDGEVRSTPNNSGSTLSQHTGYIAGSKALDTLDKFITSTESYFHPSNSGPWSIYLTTFLHCLSGEFYKRIQEENLETCTTPPERRLTSEIRRSFVQILRTPCLLAMFSKDTLSMTFAQAAVRQLAHLEPNLLMPDLLERAYNGLEVVNETHRTTAVLSMLSIVASQLTTEENWLGGQKHVVPLLELCIPGIDLNDPLKTVCTTMFITAVVQDIKIGDLSMHQSGVALSGDVPPDEVMIVDGDSELLPDGTEHGLQPKLSRQEEHSLTRDSTAAFADWVTSLFRRVLALYENLPEEGGKKGTTGGKMEERIIKCIKGMLDVVCLHLSDQLFDLVLNLVYDYATKNAKSNAVRVFGQMVACMARVQPEKTLRRFLPFCTAQIEDELRHGASSTRTTSTHTAEPSDTTLHWNMSILRGCLGYGGSTLLKYKDEIISLITLLVEKTKSERGYTGTGRLITRTLHTLTGVYPIVGRFMNEDEWNDPSFQTDHYLYWGKQYGAQEAEIEWHVPSDEEVDCAIEILEKIATPALDKVEALLARTSSWDNVDRNDFCRYLHAVRSVWAGLPTIYREEWKESANPYWNVEIDIPELIPRGLDVESGFTLTDPSEPHYQQFKEARQRFGEVCQKASSALRQNTGGEDHNDAVISVIRALDTYLLGYGVTKAEYESIQQNYILMREGSRLWARQTHFPRTIFVNRARAYHTGRIYVQALFRRRTELDDRLLSELMELSLSHYTRIRRQAQSVFHNVAGYYVRAARFLLPVLYHTLEKGNDPDRMKGALYILWNKGIAGFALSDHFSHPKYLLSLLGCQNEEKPSIQKLVTSVANDCLNILNEDTINVEAYTLDTSRVEQALHELESEFSDQFINTKLLREALQKGQARSRLRNEIHQQTVGAILEIATKPATHWRYIQISLSFLSSLLRRDFPISPNLAQFFLDQSTSPQPGIRTLALLALERLLRHIKIRTYANSKEELWFKEWRSPLAEEIEVGDPEVFLNRLRLTTDVNASGHYFDKIPTGFVAWKNILKGYKPVTGDRSPFVWEKDSQGVLDVLESQLLQPEHLRKLVLLWSQETGKGSGNVDMRVENICIISIAVKMLERYELEKIFEIIEPLFLDADKFKQRAGAEVWAGLIRGSKHWPRKRKAVLEKWTAERLGSLLNNIKPEMMSFWETLFTWILGDRDPRRHRELSNWILSLPMDFSGDSAFQMKKSMALVNIFASGTGVFFTPLCDKYANIIFDNANTDYAEIRTMFCHTLRTLVQNQWRPWHPSVSAFLDACTDKTDPLSVRDTKYLDRIEGILKEMPKWREQRLPPPRVSQSEYDKVGLTLLEWLWISAHGPQVAMFFPYATIMLPEILRMSELNDSSDLHRYSSGVLYILSAVSPPVEYIETILSDFVTAIKSTSSWRTRLQTLPILVVFFYRNLLYIPQEGVSNVMEVLMDCLADENVEVREMASKTLAGVVRCSQRQSIIPLKNHFVSLVKKTTLPPRRDTGYADALRTLHSAILGVCALIESVPYSVEFWVPPLTEVLASHATDPVPISTTIRKCASEFKKTHQDTWHKDQLLFNEDQLQSLSTMLVGTSYYA